MMLKEAVRVAMPLRRPVFVTDKRFIDRLELAELLKLCGKIPKNCPLQKVDRIVKSSVAIAAGYNVDMKQKYSRHGKRRLVSFGHATGDGVLVACVDRIAVHPEYDENNLGRQTLQRLTRDLQCMDVSEILTIASSTETDLFASCDYGPDPEHSTLMSLSTSTDKSIKLQQLPQKIDFQNTF